LEEQAWKTFWKLYPYNTNDRTCKQLQACPVLATLEKKRDKKIKEMDYNHRENQRFKIKRPKIQNKITRTQN
jgi:hypothetical protein